MISVNSGREMAVSGSACSSSKSSCTCNPSPSPTHPNVAESTRTVRACVKSCGGSSKRARFRVAARFPCRRYRIVRAHAKSERQQPVTAGSEHIHSVVLDYQVHH